MMSAAVSHIPSASPVAQRSPWHSPVPYLFGGLAAMLGLIAFALLILACSYWKLSGYLENNEEGSGDRDLELGETNSDEKPKLPPVMEEKFLVIMAGQEKPTFLATPMSSRASSFGSNTSSVGSSSTTCSEMSEKTEEGDDQKEKLKQGSEGQVQTGNMENHENPDQIP